MARFLAGVHPDGRLELPTAARRAQLLLGPASAQVVDGNRRLDLQWEAFGEVGLGRTAWGIGIVPGRVGTRGGISVVADGELDRAARQHFGRMPLWRRMDQPYGAYCVPLTGAFDWRMHDRESTTVDALCQVLAGEPSWRAGLADRGRVLRLAADLNGGWRGTIVERSGLRRARVETMTALQRCGFVHRYRRPLAGDVLPPLDEVVARLRAFVEANPYAHDVDVPDELLVEVAERDYLAIEPWPFGALRPDGS